MKIGVTGCSHSSKNYGGKPWWYWMGEEYKVEVVPTSSRGGANEINIEKLKYIFDNYTDISHVVIQLTHPARITMGVSVLKEEEEIGPHSPTMVNGAQVINFTTVRNDNYIKSMFYEDYTPSLDFIYNQSVASRYNLEFKLIHTTQCFHASVLKEAYLQTFHERITDDASLVEANGVSIHLVESNEENIKITTPNDLKIAELFIQEFQK